MSDIGKANTPNSVKRPPPPPPVAISGSGSDTESKIKQPQFNKPPPPPPPALSISPPSSQPFSGSAPATKTIKIVKGDPNNAPPPPPPPKHSSEGNVSKSDRNNAKPLDTIQAIKHLENKSEQSDSDVEKKRHSNSNKKVRFSFDLEEQFKDREEKVESEGSEEEQSHNEHDHNNSHHHKEAKQLSINTDFKEHATDDDDEDESQYEQLFGNMTQKLEMFRLFQIVEGLSSGTHMKLSIGVAGDTPNQDSFPMFKSSKKHMYIHWGMHILVEDWCLAFFDNAAVPLPTDNSSISSNQRDTVAASPRRRRLSINSAKTTIPLSDISEVYLDAKSTTSFRFYCGQEVTQCTPIVSTSKQQSIIASHWADAIYSAIQLQSFAYDEEELFEQYYAGYHQSISDETLPVSSKNNSPQKSSQHHSNDEMNEDESEEKKNDEEEKDVDPNPHNNTSTSSFPFNTTHQSPKPSKKSLFSSVASAVRRASVMLSPTNDNKGSKGGGEIEHKDTIAPAIVTPAKTARRWSMFSSAVTLTNNSTASNSTMKTPFAASDNYDHTTSFSPNNNNSDHNDHSNYDNESDKHSEQKHHPNGDESNGSGMIGSKLFPESKDEEHERDNDDVNSNSDESEVTNNMEAETPSEHHEHEQETQHHGSEEDGNYPTFSTMNDFISQSLMSSNQMKLQQRRSILSVNISPNGLDTDVSMQSNHSKPLVSPIVGVESKESKGENNVVMQEKIRHEQETKKDNASLLTIGSSAPIIVIEKDEEQPISNMKPFVATKTNTGKARRTPMIGDTQYDSSQEKLVNVSGDESVASSQTKAKTLPRRKRSALNPSQPSATTMLFNDDSFYAKPAVAALQKETTAANEEKRIIADATGLNSKQPNIQQGVTNVNAATTGMKEREKSPHKQLGKLTVLDKLYEQTIHTKKESEDRQKAWLIRLQQYPGLIPGTKLHTFPTAGKPIRQGKLKDNNGVKDRVATILENQKSTIPSPTSSSSSPPNISPNSAKDYKKLLHHRRQQRQQARMMMTGAGSETEEEWMMRRQVKEKEEQKQKKQNKLNLPVPASVPSPSPPKLKERIVSFSSAPSVSASASASAAVEKKVSRSQQIPATETKPPRSSPSSSSVTPQDQEHHSHHMNSSNREQAVMKFLTGKTNTLSMQSSTAVTAAGTAVAEPVTVPHKGHHHRHHNTGAPSPTTTTAVTPTPIPNSNHNSSPSVPSPKVPKRQHTFTTTNPILSPTATATATADNTALPTHAINNSNGHPRAVFRHQQSHSPIVPPSFANITTSSSPPLVSPLSSSSLLQRHHQQQQQQQQQSRRTSVIAMPTPPSPDPIVNQAAPLSQDQQSSPTSTLSSSPSQSSPPFTAIFVNYHGQIISMALLSKIELQTKLLQITTATGGMMSVHPGMQTTFTTYHTAATSSMPLSGPPSSPASSLRTTQEMHLLQTNPGLFHLSPAMVTLTMTMILAEHLESDYYLELANISSEEADPEEYVYIPLQDLLNIDIDPSASGLFRLQLQFNSSQYPIVYSVTHQHGNNQTQQPRVNRLFTSMISGKRRMMNAQQQEIVQCVMKGVDVDMLLPWLTHMTETRKQLLSLCL